MASLDGKVDFPVGIYYGSNKGGARYIEELNEDISRTAQKCSSCLDSGVDCQFFCSECFGGKSVCEACSVVGNTRWHPLLRPCQCCASNSRKCKRLTQICWSTDCDAKQKAFMNIMLRSPEKYPYQSPIPDCPHNTKSVRSAEFWYWLDIDGFLVNVRLLLMIRRHEPDDGSENKMKKYVSLNALRNKDRMDVETALEIHRKAVQDAIPDKKLVVTLVPELEFKFWKRNCGKPLQYPFDVCFVEKFSKLLVTNREHHAVFMIDMHCPCSVTLIAGGVQAGHSNGKGKDATFRNPSGIAFLDNILFVCDTGNGVMRAIYINSLFYHASRINEDTEDEGEKNTSEDCATRRVRNVTVRDLFVMSETDFNGLLSPVAICSSKEDNVLYVLDIFLRKVLSLSDIHEDETHRCVAHFKLFANSKSLACRRHLPYPVTRNPY